MIRLSDRWKSGLALITALVAALSLAACGRKAGLDSPPSSYVTNTPQSQPSLGDSGPAFAPAFTPAQQQQQQSAQSQAATQRVIVVLKNQAPGTPATRALLSQRESSFAAAQAPHEIEADESGSEHRHLAARVAHACAVVAAWFRSHMFRYTKAMRTRPT